MLRSMFSGVSGLRAHQTMMDVVGNNIANVNTAGFKASQVVFQDTLSQMVRAAGAPQGTEGGSNPAQVGLGVRVGGITGVFTQGATQLTGRSTDMTIQGDGFFAVRRGTETLYTRAGAFSLDANGTLVTPDGAVVRGWQAAADGSIDTTGPLADLRLPLASLQSFTLSPDGTLVGHFSSGVKQPLGQVALASFNNPAGLERVGDSMFRDSVNSGNAQVGTAGTGGRGSLASGSLEMSNVDLAQEFTSLITAQRGFQVNSKIITASDDILQDLVNLKR